MTSHWALDYLGRPWVSGESDCYALVRDVYKRVRGIELPIIDITQAEPLRLRHAMETESIAWALVEIPQDTDVVLMSQASRPHHVGLWADVDGGRIVHSVEGAGVVAPALAALKLSGWRILGYYRKLGA